MIDDEHLEDASTAALNGVRNWRVWVLVLVLCGSAILVGAATMLSHRSLGTSLSARSCDGGVVGAVALLMLGALLVTSGMSLARLRHTGAVLVVDASTLSWTLPLPLLLLVAALPAVAGCRIVRSMDDLPLLGDALVGTSALVLTIAAAVLVAGAVASVLAVSWPMLDSQRPDEPLGIVELAVREAEALEADDALHRFRNVDDE